MPFTKLLLCGCVLLSLGGKQEDTPHAPWLTGPPLRQHLTEPVNLLWSENPLCLALRNLAQVHRVAVFLDCRVDPGKKVDLALRDVSLKEAFRRIAYNQGLGVTLLGPVVYFGPPQAAARLRTLAAMRTEDVQSLPPHARRNLLRTAPLAWADFAVPRDVLGRLARENGLTLTGLEQIPYDCWAAAEWPPMTLADRLTLLLTPFERTFKISADGNRLTLIAIPTGPSVTRTYPGGRRPQQKAKRFAALAPEAQITIKGNQIVVRGRLEDHGRIAGPGESLHGTDRRSQRVPLARKRFTLTVVEKPIGPLLRQLAAQIGLQLKMDSKAFEQAGVSLDQRVSFRVKNAAIDELLQAAIQNTPLRYRRRGNLLVIEPLPPEK